MVHSVYHKQKQLRHLLQVRKMHAMSEVDTLSQQNYFRNIFISNRQNSKLTTSLNIFVENYIVFTGKVQFDYRFDMIYRGIKNCIYCTA